MPDAISLYLERNAGDLITAEDWNDLQKKIRQDIEATTHKAVDEITRVDKSDNADKLEGKSAAELIEEAAKRAVQEVRAESGYKQIFKVLHVGEEKTIKHGLGLAPLVDVYRLDYFPVVYREDDATYPAWATFYLTHSCERRIRFTDKEGTARNFEIQPAGGPAYKIAFSDLLQRFKVPYDDESSMEDLITEFWDALFKDPNDEFDDNQYGYSPWFERCCKEKKSVRDMKRNGDWDEIWFQMRPSKSAYFPPLQASTRLEQVEAVDVISLSDAPVEANVREVKALVAPPTQVQVVHYDFDTVGLKLLSPPFYPRELFEGHPAGPIAEQIPGVENELKVMVLLKV